MQDGVDHPDFGVIYPSLYIVPHFVNHDTASNPIYGFILTAWGAAGVEGGFVFAEFNKQQSLYTAAGLLVVRFVIALLFSRPKHVSEDRK